MLDEILLKRLEQVHKCGSFASAAEELFISRQALVEQISVLEKQIGFPLFTRSNRGVRLTPAGEIYLKYALQLAESYKSLLLKCKESSTGISAITFGLLPNLPSVTLPKICQEFKKLYPSVTFHFQDFPLSYYFNQFHNGGFDITSEYIMNYYHDEEELCFLPLKKIPQHIGVLRESALAGKNSLSFSDLRGHALVMYKEGIGKAEDELRSYLVKNEPDIRIIDIESYDSSLITKCMLEDAAALLYTTKSYPALCSIPATWDITIELGIGYHKNPPLEIQEFLSLAESLNNKANLF